MKSNVYVLSSILAVLAAACGGAPESDQPESADVSEQDISRRLSVKVARTDLVSDQPGLAATTDANLKNAWGIAFNPAGPAWVSNAGTSTTTVYDATGKLLLTVGVPAAAGDAEGSVHASYLGSLLGPNGKKLAIEGLWALAVSPTGDLFFTAGPGGEDHGVFGKLTLAH